MFVAYHGFIDFAHWLEVIQLNKHAITFFCKNMILMFLEYSNSVFY